MGGCHPLFFFSFFFLDDKTSEPDVFCSCLFPPRAHFERSLVMVSYYGYEIWRSRWSSHFWIKMHVFKLLPTMKLKLVDEMVESVYLCIILHVKNKKWSFIEVLTWINKKWRPKWRPLLMPSQASSSATTNKMYLILLRRAKAFHWRQNRLEILQHIKNCR